MSFTSVGESETGSVFGAVSSFFASFVPTAYAEEEEEEEAASDDAQEEEGSADEEEEDEDEDDEPEDPRDEIYAACEEKDCAPAKHHFDECQTRVEAGKLLFEGEDCIEELCVQSSLLPPSPPERPAVFSPAWSPACQRQLCPDRQDRMLTSNSASSDTCALNCGGAVSSGDPHLAVRPGPIRPALMLTNYPLVHLAHCASECTAPKLFAKLV